jgi:hypothetical protein
LRNPQPAQVVVIASQAAQYSAVGDMQIEAQRKATRALAYYDRLTPYLIYENQIEKMGSPKLAILPSAQALGEDAWQELLKYVDGGGNLLITGPVDRDEHWQKVPRAGKLLPQARTIPLTYHNAAVVPQDASPAPNLQRMRNSPLSFDLQAQGSLESLRIPNASFTEINHGKGRIFWAAEPVELAQGDQATADVYSYVAGRVGIQPQFELATPLSPGVIVYPITLGDSVLYVFVSDSAESSNIDLRDKATGVRITLNLPAEHAGLALVGKKETSVIAKYGF